MPSEERNWKCGLERERRKHAEVKKPNKTVDQKLNKLTSFNLDTAPPVFSVNTCKEMGLVERIYLKTGKQWATCPEGTSKSQIKFFTDSSDSPGDDVELFTGLGCLPGEHTIEIDRSYTPVVHPPRRVPLALKEQIKEELQRMKDAGVIVKQTEPTDWVNSMVTVIKPEKIRVCIDPRDLNRAIKREHYPMKTIEEVVAGMPEAKVFSVLDATSGYWQMKLNEESSKLCTFNTPFGRYRFTRLPFGIKSAAEVFQKKMSQVLEDIDGAEAIVDDILVWGKYIQEHDARLKKVLDRVQEVNLKLNQRKCQIRKEEIAYVGHLLTKDGLKPDPEKHGIWEKQQEDGFQQLKRMATSAPVLSYYDPKKPVTLSVNASSKGRGAVLYQEEKPVVYASRALTPTQQKYAQIEKETLAIVFGTTKFHQFLFGKEVLVTSDHKPLEYIFNKPLHQAPLRLQKMLLTLQRYELRIVYKPGKELFIADALSSNYLEETKETLVQELEVNKVHLTAHLPISPEKYQEFQKATADDVVMQAVQDAVLEGWPKNKANAQAEIKPYWTCKDEISCVDGLLFKGNKLIVPKSLRPQMLDIIHESHQGIVKCKQRARDLLYWPGMTSQIEDKVSKCQVCCQYQKAQARELIITSKIPDRPWAKIGVDLFEHNKTHYLLSVDYHSNAEFAEFSKKYGFTHITSSPHYPQANGEAERAVQTVKGLLTKDPYKALMNHRNTPLKEINQSPAQLMMGRRLKTSIPTAAPLLKSRASDEVQRILKKQKEYYDKHTGKELPPLQPGETNGLKPKFYTSTSHQDHMSLKVNKDKSIEETAVICVPVNYQRKNRGVMLNMQAPKSRGRAVTKQERQQRIQLDSPARVS
ncbi:Transposon Ty3-G Gag-Pol poly [Paramuricea clavata]|uniref:Transposon Ty3-G Gag-Pol poly n=1 Tax=Paramuricea clavata TaxID=317549 RepID=A0A7D9H9W0_PARCT|nr:Transposon Ty3-G Gag-Pol poly [Paramuricea clavata]